MGIFSRFLRRDASVQDEADDGEALVREIHQARTDIKMQADQSIRMARVATSRSRDREARLVRGQSPLTDYMRGPEPTRPAGDGEKTR